MKKIYYLLNLFTVLVLMNACSDDDSVDPPQPGAYENGYFVSNEGPFQNGSGSITFVGDDGEIVQNAYFKENDEDLGNVVNSMAIYGDRAYVVVNNSHKVVVVNKKTLKKVTAIEGNFINNPRHFIGAQSVGFISNWGDPNDPDDDYIAVVDITTSFVIRTIPVGEGPERMAISGGKLFVCLQGGYGQNNKVEVISINDLEVMETLTVGDVPNSILADSFGDIWVLCGGVPAWTNNETNGALYHINHQNYATDKLEFSMGEHPSFLNYDADNLYYSLGGKVYKMDPSDDQLPLEALAGLDGFYYTMKVNNGELYGTDAGDFASEGNLKVYNVNSGELLETIPTGIIPGDVVFP